MAAISGARTKADAALGCRDVEGAGAALLEGNMDAAEEDDEPTAGLEKRDGAAKEEEGAAENEDSIAEADREAEPGGKKETDGFRPGGSCKIEFMQALTGVAESVACGCCVGFQTGGCRVCSRGAH